MPNKKIECGRVPRVKGLDKRLKLTADQREEIRKNKDCLSHGDLAKKYHVSKRLIQFILKPELLAANKQRRKERGGWIQYYNKDDHKHSTQAHRLYKAELLARGELE